MPGYQMGIIVECFTGRREDTEINRNVEDEMQRLKMSDR